MPKHERQEERVGPRTRPEQLAVGGRYMEEAIWQGAVAFRGGMQTACDNHGNEGSQ